MYEERFCYRVHSKGTGLMGEKFNGDLKCLLKTMVMDLNACQRQTGKKDKFILRIEYTEIDVCQSRHMKLSFTNSINANGCIFSKLHRVRHHDEVDLIPHHLKYFPP